MVAVTVQYASELVVSYRSGDRSRYAVDHDVRDRQGALFIAAVNEVPSVWHLSRAVEPMAAKAIQPDDGEEGGSARGIEWVPRRGRSHDPLMAAPFDAHDSASTKRLSETEKGEVGLVKKIFVSYARSDQKPTSWRDKFLQHTVPYSRQGRFVVWHDEKIEMGAVWKEEIEHQLETSLAAVLLVGPGFLASPFVQDEEIPRLLDRFGRDGLKIFPIIVSSCAYETSELGRHQSYNDPSKPLDCLAGPDSNREMQKFVQKIDSLI